MQYLINPSGMKEIDRQAIEDIGLPGIVLMENAGNAVVKAIEQLYPDKRRIMVICGKGNNGGDGYVAARMLFNAGLDIAVFCTFQKNYLPGGDAGVNFSIIKKLGINIKYLDELEGIEDEIGRSDLIVDAIFGTGINSLLREPYTKIIEFINRSGKTVVSVDIPSGIDGNSGQVLGEAVRADLTVTFAYSKTGHFIYPGKKHRGRLIRADIGIPGSLLDSKRSIILIEEHDIRKMIIRRENDSHKGDYGHLCIIGGSRGKLGAVMMSGLAALRSGAGLVSIATIRSAADMVNASLFETMAVHLEEDENGFISSRGVHTLLDQADRFSVYAIGPGLGVSESTSDFLYELLKGLNKPAVLDADALNIISKDRGRFSFLAEREIILTPHPGELSRFFSKKTAEDILKNITAHTADLSREFDAVTVSKGATTFICDRGRETYCIEGDCPQLAKGGSGDVLTGIIGALAANGLSLIDSSLAGAYLHKLAATLSADEYNERSLMARDLTEYISEGLFHLENQ